MYNKINEKYLEEAKKLNYKFDFLDMEYFARNKTAVLLESVRLRNEYQTDEEYNAYLEDFNKRYKNVQK